MNLPSKTLVLRLSSIGDIVLTSPLLRTMRQAAGKNARIDFVVKKEFAELVSSNHHLSITYEYDSATGFSGLRSLASELRREEYELVVDLHDSVRTKFLRNSIGARKIVVVNKRKFARWQLIHLHRNIYTDHLSVAERYLETVQEYGIENDNKGLEIFIPDIIQFEVNGKIARLRLNKFDKVIGICPGAKHFTKCWQKEKFAEVALCAAKEMNAKILLFGGKAEKEVCEFVKNSVNTEKENFAESFAGEFSLLESTQALEYCDLVVTNDSALMHLAAAKQKKIVAIFGSTVKEFGFFPYGTEAIVIENNSLNCRPCTHIGRESCPQKHFKCMKDISVGQVFSAVKSMLW